MKVILGISNRHVHLTRDVYYKLFDSDITKLRDLRQPSQFVANEVVSIKTAYGSFSNVRIIGPFRDYNQVEVSMNDARKLGVNPPIRTSGDVDGSLPVTITGPLGSVDLECGLILANRHMHISSSDVVKYGLSGVEKVAVSISSKKSGVLTDVYLKESSDGVLELHLDTDDSNAFLLESGEYLDVLKIKERK